MYQSVLEFIFSKNILIIFISLFGASLFFCISLFLIKVIKNDFRVFKLQSKISLQNTEISFLKTQLLSQTELNKQRIAMSENTRNQIKETADTYEKNLNSLKHQLQIKSKNIEVITDNFYKLCCIFDQYIIGCETTKKLIDKTWILFMYRGVSIYKWEVPCLSCLENTNVYSYFLYYEYESYTGEKVSNKQKNEVCLGDVRVIDEVLLKKFKTLIDTKGIASPIVVNTCEHCSAVISRCFSDKSLEDFFNSHDIDEYKIMTINFSLDDELTLNYRDICKFFGDDEESNWFY